MGKHRPSFKHVSSEQSELICDLRSRLLQLKPFSPSLQKHQYPLSEIDFLDIKQTNDLKIIFISHTCSKTNSVRSTWIYRTWINMPIN